MKRLLLAMVKAGSSWTITPLVIGLFFLIYIGIAFFTDETLIALMAFTRKSIILAALLALIPLNSAFRILRETGTYLTIRRVLSGKKADVMPELFDDAVELPASPSITELESRLAAEGYRTRRSENTLAAWRGISAFPVRALFLAGTFCLFTGILVSVTTRTSQRRMVIEGEPLPTPEGTGGTVDRIALANSSGSILSRTLTMEVAPSGSGYGKSVFGLYPPSLYGGFFVYPRYLGIALHFSFFAPDMPSGYETHCTLNTYPPGKEDNAIIPDSPYRIIFSIQEPDAGSDRYTSYMTGNITLRFKLLKGKEILFTGSAPGGGKFVRDGYRLALPDIRRLVVTDFIRDYGVLFIWWSALLFGAAVCIWLPIRVFFPRREMVFRYEPDATRACSRAEGGSRKHAGVFHEALDLVDARKTEG
ncbi:MAG TPA: hypothetical protein VN642_02330 [Dongiaceae bacterium]|nr:hypothetical protein [Dongiaceae bacterium]